MAKVEPWNAEKVRRLMARYDDTVATFARRAKVSERAVRYWLVGARVPGEDVSITLTTLARSDDDQDALADGAAKKANLADLAARLRREKKVPVMFLVGRGQGEGEAVEVARDRASLVVEVGGQEVVVLAGEYLGELEHEL